MQYFKGDDTEIKMYMTGDPIMDQIMSQLQLFYDGAYTTAVLGDLIYESNRAPLANAIDQTIFRDSFSEIFEAFQVSGTFESYMTVFRKIFGADVEVEFTVPAPGKLEIDITATGLEISTWRAREVSGSSYIFHDMVDDTGDSIAFRTVKGFETQYQLEQMLFEMVPAGIYTTISLTVG